ncbi:hypothetical protein BDW59DRAFT_149870 [Aspergillus cavernicola]|uniref:F-box domain-containing protein n=1 Tax=Aspergillus cavernicola TaxID=176166 RepID=A0ABR4I266_9EURO
MMDLGLFALPNELLLAIFRLLPTVTKHTFSLSCSRLSFTFASLCPELSLDARHELRTQLARDGLAFREYAYCSRCRSVHSLKFFSTDQLDRPPTTRLCSASRKQLWIEPHRFYSFQDLSKQLSRVVVGDPHRPLKTNCSVVMRLYSKDRIRDRDATNYHNMWAGVPVHYAVCTSYEILTLTESKSATKSEIIRVLKGFDIPICPHTRLGDAAIADSYQQSRHSSSQPTKALVIWNGQIQSDGADAWCKFPGCKTVFRWGCHPSLKKDGWKTVSIHVKRYLGNLLSPFNPRWMAQLVSIPHQALLEAYWTDCHEWKNVNTAIDEKSYERSPRGSSDALNRAEQVKYKQLRSENDYLRHPHRNQNRTEPDLDCLSNLRDPDQPPDELPSTTLLLLEGQHGHPQPTIHPDGTFRVHNDEWETRIKESDISDGGKSSEALLEAGQDSDLFTPLHTPEAILESIEGHAKFDELFDNIRALTPYQRRIENLFWGAGDCLSMHGVLFGLLPPWMFPRRRILVDQLYHLPRSVKRLILNYEETEERFAH